MVDEKKIETLEGELKLIKGELKESLAGVRDFLLSLKLPASAGAINLGPDEESLLNLGGGLTMDSARRRPAAVMPGVVAPEEPPAPQGAQTEAPPETPRVREVSNEMPQFREAPSGTPRVREVSSEMPQFSEAPPETPQLEEMETPFPSAVSEPPEQEVPPSQSIRYEEAPETGQRDRMEEQVSSMPQVNMLANLIRWVSVARGKLGIEQLPTFLEVYGICGNLSLELKEVILHLADLAEQQSEDAGVADVWSQLILELHGILTGGGTPVQPSSTFWNGEEDEAQIDETEMEVDIPEGEPAGPEEDKPAALPEDRPVRLKLVVPTADGSEREVDVGELSVGLSREKDGGDSSEQQSTP